MQNYILVLDSPVFVNLVETVTALKVICNQLVGKIDRLLVRQNIAPEELEGEFDQRLPLDSIEELQLICSMLEDCNKSTQFVSLLFN